MTRALAAVTLCAVSRIPCELKLVRARRTKEKTMDSFVSGRRLGGWALAALLVLSSSSIAQAEEAGTMAGLLRRTLEAIQRGSPNLDDMEPLTADAVQKQASVVQPMLSKMGTIDKITYRGLQSMPGVTAEAYKVQFERGSMTWAISKTAAGKIQVLWTPGPD